MVRRLHPRSRGPAALSRSSGRPRAAKFPQAAGLWSLTNVGPASLRLVLVNQRPRSLDPTRAADAAAGKLHQTSRFSPASDTIYFENLARWMVETDSSGMSG